MSYSHIPLLPHNCNSWIVTRKDNGKVIGEFYSLRNVKKFDSSKVVVTTAYEYLVTLNRKIAQGN
jgi:hypothetical protein